MVDERVAEVTFTDCFEVYVPPVGLKLGAAAAGTTIVYAAEPMALFE
jgi:hypothetical protein